MYRTYEQIFSDRIQVKHNPQVKLEFTADDWQLYDGEGYERRDVAARVMNEQIANAIHVAKSKGQAYMICQKILQRWMNSVRLTVKAGRCWTLYFVQCTGRVNDVVCSYKYTQSLG
jgi:hypothetical protein